MCQIRRKCSKTFDFFLQNMEDSMGKWKSETSRMRTGTTNFRYDKDAEQVNPNFSLLGIESTPQPLV